MSKQLFPALALIMFAGACASVSGDAAAPRAGRFLSVAEGETGAEAVVALDPTRQGEGEAPRSDPVQTGNLSEAALAIWNSPAFQKQFTESYLSETEIEPGLTVNEHEHVQGVLEHMAENRMDKALELLDKHGRKGASAVFDFLTANIYVQRERLDEALVALRKAIDKHPKFRRAWQNLGWLYFRQGEATLALPALTRTIELGGGTAVTYGMLAFSYANQGNHLSAETAYRMAILLDPDTVDWKKGLAISLFQQRRFADAAALFDTLIAAQPDSAELWLAQANAYIGLGKPLKAAENYEMVDYLGASTLDSLSNLGDIYVNEQLFDLAASYFVRALEKDPKAYFGRAMRSARDLSIRGALDETSLLVERIEALVGDELGAAQRAELLRLRARVAMERGGGEAEALLLEEIVALDPLDGKALILLGDHESRAGDVEKAAFYYERAGSVEAFEAEAKVRHAQLLVGEQRYGEALPLLRRALALEDKENVRAYLEQVELISKAR
jgi:tetratricopeptide (TPR) repeat protein